MILRIIFASFILGLTAAVFLLPKNVFKKDISNTLGQKIEVAASQNSIENHPKAVLSFKPAPTVTARSVIIIDAKTGTSLWEKEPNLKHLPASTTKMMTALTALEKCSPTDVVVVKSLEKEGTQMGLEIGDSLTIENLLYGLLINSGNDAAYVLANSCSDSYAVFIEAMNSKAEELKMTNTHFANPAGFDDPIQYSTAADLAKLAKVVTANPLIAKIVTTKSTVVTDVSGNRTYFLENVNKLLGIVEGVEGVKTGQTEGSLEILITKTTRNNNSIITAVLGSKDRFGESKELINWSFENFTWKNN